MSAIIRDKDVQVVIGALYVAAEIYLRDAISSRVCNLDTPLTRQFLEQQEQALRVAAELERSGCLPMFLRKQAE